MADAQMSFATITGGFLKRNYGKGSKALKNMQNLKAAFYNHVPKSDEKPVGDGFYLPVNVEGNESGHASNESEAFEDAQSVTDVQFRIQPKHTFWPFQLTGFAMDVGQSNAGSYARSLKRQQKDNLSRFLSDLNRQSWGTGTGQMSLVDGVVTASTSVICDSVILFRVGMRIDIYASVGGAIEMQNKRITSINVSTKTLTIDSAGTCSDNAVIVKRNVLNNAPSDYKEFFGASAIVDTTAFNNSIQNVSKVTYPVLQATVTDASNVLVTNALLQENETGIENASEDAVVEKWSDRFQRDNYLKLLTPLKRFMNDDAMDSGKRKPIEHNGKPWYVDKDAPASTIFQFSKGYIERFCLTEPDIVDKDGAVIRALPGSDVYQGYYKCHENMGSLKPNAGGKIINLTE